MAEPHALSRASRQSRCAGCSSSARAHAARSSAAATTCKSRWTTRLLVGAAPDDDASIDLVALDRALLVAGRDSIAEQARIVELRFFGGLSVEETAEALAISPATVKRHWTIAQSLAAARAAAAELAVSERTPTLDDGRHQRALSSGARPARGPSARRFSNRRAPATTRCALEVPSLLDAHERADEFIERRRSRGRSQQSSPRPASADGARRPDDRPLPDRARARRRRHGRRVPGRRHAARPRGRAQGAGAAVHAASRRGANGCDARREPPRRSRIRASRPSTRSKSSTITSTSRANTCQARRCATSSAAGRCPRSA